MRRQGLEVLIDAHMSRSMDAADNAWPSRGYDILVRTVCCFRDIRCRLGLRALSAQRATPQKGRSGARLGPAFWGIPGTGRAYIYCLSPLPHLGSGGCAWPISVSHRTWAKRLGTSSRPRMYLRGSGASLRRALFSIQPAHRDSAASRGSICRRRAGRPPTQRRECAMPAGALRATRRPRTRTESV